MRREEVNAKSDFFLLFSVRGHRHMFLEWSQMPIFFWVNWLSNEREDVSNYNMLTQRTEHNVTPKSDFLGCRTVRNRIKESFQIWSNFGRIFLD